MKEKQTEIVIEIRENIEVEGVGACFEAFCPECKKLVEMASPRVCALRKKISEREIFRLIEAQQIHFVENREIFVCWESCQKRCPDLITDDA